MARKTLIRGADIGDQKENRDDIEKLLCIGRARFFEVIADMEKKPVFPCDQRLAAKQR